MKRIKIVFVSICQKACAPKYSFPVYLLAVVLAITFGFNLSPSIAQSVAGASPKVHVAFAGGGWRAHTGHSAWTISLLNKGARKLGDAFENVGTISSNSGGSWFSTMLLYSDKFDAAIENPDAIKDWDTQKGWLGQQRKYFDAFPCRLLSGDPYVVCVFNKYTKCHPLTWNSMVNDLVFKDYPLGSSTLGGAHQAWAANKPLLLASTMLTNSVVLDKDPGWCFDAAYYQACIAPSKPGTHGSSLADCSNGPIPDVSPVTFSSIPSGSRLKPLPFLREAATGSINLGYSNNKDKRPKIASATIQNPLSCNQVPVQAAAAASSAALGFGASKKVDGKWLYAYLLEDEALSYSLLDSNVQFLAKRNLNMTVKQLANKKVVRLADGGPVDNSGVAQLVSFLQLNDQAEDFNIVAFDNVQEFFTPNRNAADIGIDLASLFGEGICQGSQFEQFCGGLKCGTPCIDVPPLQVFDSLALSNTPMTWGASKDSGHRVIYTKYVVTTVDNSVLGIKAGSKGTLHAFTCIWADADTAPESKNFNAYADMLKFINSSLLENNGKGLGHLETALGLQH